MDKEKRKKLESQITKKSAFIECCKYTIDSIAYIVVDYLDEYRYRINRIQNELNNFKLRNTPSNIITYNFTLERDFELLNNVDILKKDRLNDYLYHIRLKGVGYYSDSYRITYFFTKNYPFKPPVIRFLDKIYHPLVDYETGRIKIEDNEWYMLANIENVIQIFMESMIDLEKCKKRLFSIVNFEAMEMYEKDKELFQAKAMNIL